MSSYHETAGDALKAWDCGEIVWTIEMGGLGPGYEQAIHALVFELIRDRDTQPLPLEGDQQAWWDWGDPTVHRCHGGGFSGAQVGAAKQIAVRAIRDGWRSMVESVERDRRIMVSQQWPGYWGPRADPSVC